MKSDKGAFFLKLKHLFFPQTFHKNKINILTKSGFLSGQKCSNLLIHYGNPEIVRHKPSKDWEGNSVQTDQIRNLARNLFPDGLSVHLSSGKNDSVKETARLMKLGKPVFNAAFSTESFYSSSDILVPSADSNSWDLILVKSTPSVKKYHFSDIAFQKMVAGLCGIKISHCFILFVNQEYLFQDDVNPDLFFKKQDVTGKVDAIADITEKTANQFLELLNGKTMNGEINRCKNPSECQMIQVCWNDLEGGDIFSLREGNNIPAKLLSEGFKNLREIPSSTELSFRQAIQVNSEKTGIPFIQKDKIKSFLEKIKYPVFFLDFETINPALPLYNNSKPFQHIPFQYSLHIQETEFSEPEYVEYIEENTTDPRFEILSTLRDRISPEGSIVVYDDFFEKRCLREAVALYPEFSHWLLSVINNFADISEPFKSFSYYHPDQKGSASLKAVLPVLTGLSYKDLPIKSGGSANTEFLKLKLAPGNIPVGQKEKVMLALREYSKLDTYALYAILKKLKNLAD